MISSEERLKSVAKTGNIDFLYCLIKEDPDLLDRIDVIPFVDTPLHIAASLGHIQFAMEIMGLKPSFSRKRNPEGFNPLHLALHNNEIDMAIRLVEVDNELVRAPGKHGETALHFAARYENLLLLELFLLDCPLSILDVTIKRETVLHIAVRNYKFKAFDFLVRKLRTSVHRDSEDQESEILNKMDQNLDTILHISVQTNQPQVVKVLLDCGVSKNPKNSEGLTPLDVLQVETPENASSRNAIKRMLLKNECSSGSPNTNNASNVLSNPTSILPVSSSPHSPPDIEGQPLESKISISDQLMVSAYRSATSISNDMRSMLLVVAVLIATAGYQIALAPPGSVWQENIYDNSNDNNGTMANNSTITNSTSDHKILSHRAGTTMMLPSLFLVIEITNTIALFITVVAIFFLMPGGHLGKALFFPLYAVLYCYTLGMIIIAPDYGTGTVAFVLFSLLSLLFLVIRTRFYGTARRLKFKLSGTI